MKYYYIADTIENKETIIKWCDNLFGLRATPHTYTSRRWNWFGAYSRNWRPAIRIDIYHEEDELMFELTWKDYILDIQHIL